MINSRSTPIEYCLVAAMICVAIFSFTEMGFLKMFNDPSSTEVGDSWAASRPMPSVIAVHRSHADVSNVMN